MAKRKEDPPEGAPEWMLTYGDMITLVLCFFVLLFSMSTLDKTKVTATMKAFQRQFGVLPAYKATVQIFTTSLRLTDTQAYVLRNGPRGKHTDVQTIVEDEKTKIVIGGVSLFRANEVDLTVEGMQLLREQIAPDLKGFRNRIEVRGHTSATGFGADDQFQDAWYLSYQRAYAVMKYLSEQTGIDRRRFRVVSCADNEPRDNNLTAAGRARNRRVEIIMTEEFIKDIGLGG